MRLMQWLFMAPMALLIACSDSGGKTDPGTDDPPPDNEPPTYQLSGVVQKGPFTRLQVQARALDPATGEAGAPIDAKVTGSSYQVDVPSDQLYLIEARGEFTSEANGKTVKVEQPLQALTPLDDQDQNINVNLATHLTSERFRSAPTDTETDWRDRLEADAGFTAAALGLPAGTDSTRIDLSKVAAGAGLDDASLSLLLMSGALSDTLSSDRLFGPELTDLVERFKAASDPGTLKQELDMFAGLNAVDLYKRIQIEVPEWSLPDVSLPETPIWSCDPGMPCDWIEPPGPRLSVAAVSVYEAQGQARIKLRLSEALDQDAVIRVTTVDGTALANADYLPLQQEVIIAAGDLEQTLTLPVMVDNRNEDTEVFQAGFELLTANVQLAGPVTDIRILDGAPPGLADQTPTQVELLSACIRQVGAPTELNATDCTLDSSSVAGVSTSADDAASVAVDLGVTCASGDTCPDRETDWLVEFALLAQDGSATTLDELALGRYLYSKQSLQWQGDSPATRELLLSLSSAVTSQFLVDAESAGHALTFEARLVGASDQLSQQDLPLLVPMPEQLIAGNETLTLADGVVLSNGDAFGCTADQYGLSGDYILNPNSTLTGDICVALSPTDSGTVDAMLSDSTLDLYGAVLPLPGDVVALHSPDGALPLPGGEPELAIINSDLWRDTSVERKWLHQQGMPVMFRINGGQLTPGGLSIAYDRVQYLMDPGYSSQDPRQGGSVVANDTIYDAVSAQAGTLGIGTQGLDVSLHINSTDGYPNFPRGRIAWETFDLDYQNGELPNVVPIDVDFYLPQTGACRSVDCQAGAWMNYGVSSSSIELDDRGFLLGEALSGDGSSTPAWGARDGGGYSFSRPEDLATPTNVTLALAGYRFPATRERVSDFLVAHVEPAAGQPRHAIHPLGSAAERDGNHFPTGLSLGPQTYRDANGQPALGAGQWLTGKPLAVDNGNDQFSLPASEGAKYTIRNGGITGVFNIDSAALSGPLSFYGYDLALDRFALRLIDNEIDDVNWLDGYTEIAGDAGLKVHFENLTLDCAARFGNAEVVYESCDATDNNGNGYIDENCGQQLASWRADTEVFGMGFDGGDSANACGIGSQQLRLQQQVDFLALNQPVGLDSVWTPQGKIGDQLLALLDDYRMDAVEGKSEGFPLVPSAGEFKVDNLASDGTTRYGTFDINLGLIAVPFWESIEGDVRIANWLSGTVPTPEPSIVLPEGELNGTLATKRTEDVYLDDVSNEDNEYLELLARYPWGNTGFEFKLPVYYSPYQYNSDGQPKFLGRRLSTDLFVMEAGAGINYIDPERTKLSFGASADFERLQELNIQIDLNNPDNLAQVDTFLQNLGLISDPILKPALSQVMEPVSVINQYADKGLDAAMREGLVVAVEGLGEAAAPTMPGGQDPFVLASRSLAQVKNFPQQLAVLMDEGVKAPIDQSLDSLESELSQRIGDLNTAIESIDPNAPSLDLSVLQDARNTLDRLHEAVDTVNNQLSVPVETARSIIGELSGVIADLQTATAEIDVILEEAVSITEAQCNADNYDLNQDYGYLEQMLFNLDQVQSLLTLVEGNELLDPLLTLVASDPAVSQRLQDTQQAVQRRAEELAGYLDQAQTAIKGQVCTASVTSLMTNARAVLKKINDEVAILDDPLNDIESHLDTVDDLQSELASRVLEPIEEVSQALAKFEDDWNANAFDGMAGLDIMSELNAELARITGGQVDVLVATDPAIETGLLNLVFDIARNTLNTQYQGMRDALMAEVEPHLPGAYYSADQLRRMLVAQIMDSTPVADLRRAMNRHFSEITRQVNEVALQLTDQVNQAVQEAIKVVESEMNDALADAKAVVRDLPFKGGRLDGYGVVAGDELERAHIGAEWAMAAAEEGEDPNTFKAALDAVSWDADNKTAGCSIPDDQSRLDVTISGYNIPATIAASELTIEKVYLGFTLASGATYALAPKGVFGGIDTLGEIGFTEFVIYDPGMAAGIGDQEVYLGARAGALFSEIQAEVAFLAGRTCNQDILLELDPKVAQFIDLPASGFTGAYARGSASFPIITTGCPLTVGVGADFGAWVLVGEPTTIGGLVGGGAYGKVACVGALRGQIRAIGQVNTDGDMTFVGEGFGAAGVGSCEPSSWTSVSRSRQDSWCATGDARFQAGYQDGWSVLDMSVSAVH